MARNFKFWLETTAVILLCFMILSPGGAICNKSIVYYCEFTFLDEAHFYMIFCEFTYFCDLFWIHILLWFFVNSRIFVIHTLLWFFVNSHIFMIHTFLYFLWIHKFLWFTYFCGFFCEKSLIVKSCYISISRSCTEKHFQSCFSLKSI